MNVLVTGANGLLGHHVVMELIKQQHKVRIIVRSSKNIYFDLSTIQTFEGNFSDYDILNRAAKGCDGIVHIAAITSTDLLNYDDYTTINVGGTAQIIKVAHELKINNIVFVSSSNTIGYGVDQKYSNEHFEIQFPFSNSFYAQSKLQAEQLIVEASLKPNQHIVIVNPSFMIGAYDTKPSSGKLVIMGYKKPLMFIPKGGKNFVAVRDVAVLICNALTLGRNGERYLATGVNLTFKEYYTLQKEIGNYRQFIVEIPDFILIMIGKLGDLIRKFGIKTNLCSMNLRQLLIRENYTNQKAKAELELVVTDLKIAIKEAIDWFIARKTI